MSYVRYYKLIGMFNFTILLEIFVAPLYHLFKIIN